MKHNECRRQWHTPTLLERISGAESRLVGAERRTGLHENNTIDLEANVMATFATMGQRTKNLEGRAAHNAAPATGPWSEAAPAPPFQAGNPGAGVGDGSWADYQPRQQPPDQPPGPGPRTMRRERDHLMKFKGWETPKKSGGDSFEFPTFKLKFTNMMVACNQEAARLLEWAEKQPDAIMDVNAHGLMVDQAATEVSSQMHGVLHIVLEGRQI